MLAASNAEWLLPSLLGLGPQHDTTDVMVNLKPGVIRWTPFTFSLIKAEHSPRANYKTRPTALIPLVAAHANKQEDRKWCFAFIPHCDFVQLTMGHLMGHLENV